MDSLNSVFGRRLKSLRKAKGMTQEDLGRAAGVDYKHIGAVERGVHPPSFAAVESIARALKVDYYELFLPDRLTSLGERIRGTIPELQKLDLEGVRQFFDDLATAVRRLEGRRG